MKSKFEVFKDRRGQWRFRLVASNGRIVCQSEGYTRKSNCLAGIRALQKSAADAVVTE